MRDTLLLLFLTWLLSIDGSLSPDQKDSLLSLFYATGGPFWSINTNWDNSGDPCAPLWYGVSCDSVNQTVLLLSLRNNNLTGSLPDLHLPALEEL